MFRLSMYNVIINPYLEHFLHTVKEQCFGRLKMKRRIFRPCNTHVEIYDPCRGMIPRNSYDSVCTIHCHYPGNSSKDTKCLLPLNLLNYTSSIGIRHLSISVASFTGRRSFVVRNLDLKSCGTKCRAACIEAFGVGSIKSSFVSWEM